MNFNIKRIPLPVFWIFITFLYAVIFITIEFIGTPVHGWRGVMAQFVQWGTIAFATAGLMGIISAEKWLFAITFPILVTASSILSYFHLTLNVALSETSIELMMVNDFSVWSTMISSQLILTVITALILSVAAVILRWRYVTDSYMYLILALSVLIILITNVFSVKLKTPVSYRMPYSFYYQFKNYFTNRKTVSTERHTFDNTPVTKSSVSPDVILILGESLRADHLGLNGYSRQTTPKLAKDTAVISYPDIHTHFNGTHENLPYILTRADSANIQKSLTEESFIPLFRKAGYNSYWISNQDKNVRYAYFMSETDSTVMASPGWNPYNFRPMWDRNLLPLIDNFINNNSTRPKLLITHTMGSHWVYHINHPPEFSIFKPEVNSRVLSELSDRQLINSYDNTILATDDFLSSVINMMRNRNAIVIYISDHGENLGEDGQRLHIATTKYVGNPALLFWYSEKYALNFPEKVKALKINAGKRWTHDLLFHTILDLANLKTPVLKTDRSAASEH